MDRSFSVDNDKSSLFSSFWQTFNFNVKKRIFFQIILCLTGAQPVNSPYIRWRSNDQLWDLLRQMVIKSDTPLLKTIRKKQCEVTMILFIIPDISWLHSTMLLWLTETLGATDIFLLLGVLPAIPDQERIKVLLCSCFVFVFVPINVFYYYTAQFSSRLRLISY